MATTAASQGNHQERTRQATRLFFPGVTLFVLIAVVGGFARTYFLAGMFRAKLPSLLVHIHGALFMLWIVLLVAQVGLISSHRLRWHMRLGVAGMFLAPLMLLTGLATLIAQIKRGSLPPPVLRIVASADILILCFFAILVLWAFLARRDAATHKRLILFATFVILGPAIARWPLSASPIAFHLFLNSFPVLMVMYDLWTSRSLHRATIWGVITMIALEVAVFPLAQSASMDAAVNWLQRT
jgi:hypothetical protein